MPRTQRHTDMRDDLGREWHQLENQTRSAVACVALGFNEPSTDDSEDWLPVMALEQIGYCVAEIVKEPAFRVRPDKAARDVDLGRPTMHLAPTWRYAAEGETGVPAIIVPVWQMGENWALLMGTWREGSSVLADPALRETYAAMVCDLVAIPLDGKGRPLSRTGHTACIGPFDAPKGRLTLWASGLTWLKRYIAEARRRSADVPVHLVPSQVMPFPMPHDLGALVIEPRALEWRPHRHGCIVPRDTRQIACADSAGLGRMIDNLQRRKERPPVYPEVLGPSTGAS
jgi:hypothetical protein